jgi:tetratricopeptide (TPR) repeat protein
MTKQWKLGALLVLVTVVAYLPALRGGFIWDDDDHLTHNRAVLAADGWKRIWSSLGVSRYYPLTLTSFWAQHRLWGPNPAPYHAVNIALQAVNAVLLWTVLRRLNVPGAWLGAAVWAVHPINVESVAWVTELKNTQSGFFFLLAAWFYLRFEDGARPRDYVLALVCGAAAMLSKPSTVVLPGVLLLCGWWRRGRWNWVRLLPFFALGAGMSLLTILEQRHHIQVEGAAEWTLTWAQRLALAGHAVWFYAGKLVWPVNLTFIYPRWELPGTWLPLAALVVVAAALVHFRRQPRARAAIFGLSCFVVALLPVLGFVDIYFFVYSFVADHFQYLASMALIALAMAVVPRALGIGALIVLAVATWRLTPVYGTSESLWRDTLRKNPQAWMACINLGSELQSQGRLSEAMTRYEQARNIKPDCAEAYNNLGDALLEAGQPEASLVHCQEALRLRPNYADAHCNLGNALLRLNRPGDAIAQYEEALRLRPEHVDAHNNLGSALFQIGRAAQAEAHIREAIRLNPGFAMAYVNLGTALARTGRPDEAIRQWEQALRLQPDDAETCFFIGNALLELGRTNEAVAHYEQAARLRPDFAAARARLSQLAARRQLDGARVHP